MNWMIQMTLMKMHCGKGLMNWMNLIRLIPSHSDCLSRRLIHSMNCWSYLHWSRNDPG